MTLLQIILFLTVVVVVIGALAYSSKKKDRPGSFHSDAEDGKDQWGRLIDPNEKPTTDPAQRIVVTDIQMSFESMVILMTKWVLASMPAAIILGFASGWHGGSI